MIRIILDISSPRSLKWGVQIAGMIFKTRSRACLKKAGEKMNYNKSDLQKIAQRKTQIKSEDSKSLTSARSVNGVAPDPTAGKEVDLIWDKIACRNVVWAASYAMLYTILSSVVYSLLSASGLKLSGIALQAASLLVCLALFGWLAVRRNLTIRAEQRSVYRYPASFCYLCAVVMCSVACNYLVYLTGLSEISEGYKRVSQIFYGNGLLLEIITLCVIGPVAEELVYRGFVYQHLRRRGSHTAAALLSALLFGVLHFNLVQGAYAFVLGLLLAYIVERTGSLISAAAAHMAANLASVLWTETDWLNFLDQGRTRTYIAAVICMILTGVFISYGNQWMRHQPVKKSQVKN